MDLGKGTRLDMLELSFDLMGYFVGSFSFMILFSIECFAYKIKKILNLWCMLKGSVKFE